MYEYLLTYRFHYDETEEERYITVRSEILDICTRHRGKNDDSTSTILFRSLKPAEDLMDCIAAFFNEHPELMDDEDILRIYHTSTNAINPLPQKTVSSMRFKMDERTRIWTTHWDSYPFEFYYKHCI